VRMTWTRPKLPCYDHGHRHEDTDTQGSVNLMEVCLNGSCSLLMRVPRSRRRPFNFDKPDRPPSRNLGPLVDAALKCRKQDQDRVMRLLSWSGTSKTFSGLRSAYLYEAPGAVHPRDYIPAQVTNSRPGKTHHSIW
jgi:hypothetical protein